MRRKIKRLATRIVHRENITAVVMIISVGGASLALGAASLGFSYWRGWQATKIEKKEKQSAYMDELRKFAGITTQLQAVPDETEKWKLYENDRYNFAIKYPQDWQNPTETFPTSDNKYLLRMTFINNIANSSANNQRGFDVYIYSSSQFPGPVGTDNLSKKEGQIPGETCPFLSDISLGEEGYTAKEVDIKGGDPCYRETFFYSIKKNGYLYNIVPLETGYNISDFDDKTTLVKTFPEFYDIVSTLNLEKPVSIIQASQNAVRRTATPPRPRFTSGASCDHKNDKPRRSKQGKGKHIDEDCCPDPDEWPNPRCAYSAKALGIMISR